MKRQDKTKSELIAELKKTQNELNKLKESRKATSKHIEMTFLNSIDLASFEMIRNI